MGQRNKMSFNADFNWQTEFYEYVRQILALNSMHLITVDIADEQKDMNQATDFIVNIKGGTVAVRTRRNIGNQYRDLTIRSKRPSGHETELQKIKNGFADYYLYIWTSENKIVDWWLVDVNKMRESNLLERERIEIWNKDRSSAFIAITFGELGNAHAIISTMNTM